MIDLTRDFFYMLPRNIIRSFRGRNLLWHILAIGATVLIVSSDLDWMYFEATRPLAGYLFPAVILGWLVPVVFPVVSYIAGAVRKDRRAICSAYATAQAAVIGLLVSSFYKAFTGRPGPGHSAGMLIDTSRAFHFGFLQRGVFFGWPSSHTTVAFAMAAAIWMLYPGKKCDAMRGAALLYALYVGVGVSMTIHWFSDFIAGAIIGTAIGMTVGDAFKRLLLSSAKR
ncbi:MAG: phosphatase PAP2 family protein [Acidobacteriota bacterium]